jgi:hypothetical protein
MCSQVGMRLMQPACLRLTVQNPHKVRCCEQTEGMQAPYLPAHPSRPHSDPIALAPPPSLDTCLRAPHSPAQHDNTGVEMLRHFQTQL